MPSVFQKSPVTFGVGKAHFGQQVTVAPWAALDSVLLESLVSFQLYIPVASTVLRLSCLRFFASLLIFAVPVALLLSQFPLFKRGMIFCYTTHTYEPAFSQGLWEKVPVLFPHKISLCYFQPPFATLKS